MYKEYWLHIKLKILLLKAKFYIHRIVFDSNYSIDILRFWATNF